MEKRFKIILIIIVIIAMIWFFFPKQSTYFGLNGPNNNYQCNCFGFEKQNAPSIIPEAPKSVYCFGIKHNCASIWIEPITLSKTTLEVQQRDYASTDVRIFNDQGETGEYVLETEIVSNTENNLKCEVFGSTEFTLESGESLETTIAVTDESNTGLGLHVCKVSLTRNGEFIEEESMLIEVIE